MPPVGFEPIISAGERPQSYTLDRAATGTGTNYLREGKINPLFASEVGSKLWNVRDSNCSQNTLAFQVQSIMWTEVRRFSQIQTHLRRLCLLFSKVPG